MTNFKRQKIKDETHEDFIKSLPCLICDDNTTTECAHVSYAEPSIGKFGRGLGKKEESIWVVPMCGEHHRIQHALGNERGFWRGVGIDPCKVAAALYIRSHDYQTALKILDANRP